MLVDDRAVRYAALAASLLMGRALAVVGRTISKQPAETPQPYFRGLPSSPRDHVPREPPSLLFRSPFSYILFPSAARPAHFGGYPSSFCPPLPPLLRGCRACPGVPRGSGALAGPREARGAGGRGHHRGRRRPHRGLHRPHLAPDWRLRGRRAALVEPLNWCVHQYNVFTCIQLGAPWKYKYVYSNTALAVFTF